MDAYHKMLNEQHEASQNALNEFIKLLMNDHGCTSLVECRDFVMGELLKPCTDHQHRNGRWIYVNIKRMIREERAGVKHVY